MTMLDLGCGYGWYCKYAVDHGAAKVLGIDLSEKMLAQAKQRIYDEKIQYRHCGIETYEYPKSVWDVVVSNLTLHYVEDLEQVFRNIWQTLRSGVTFLLNIEHPVFTSGVHQDWIYREDGTLKCWLVDDYYRPGQRWSRFLGCEVIK